MSVSDLNIPRIGPHISCSRIGRSMVGIYKSLTDTWMWKLGLWPRNSFLRYWFFAVWHSCIFLHLWSFDAFLSKKKWYCLGASFRNQRPKISARRSLWNYSPPHPPSNRFANYQGCNESALFSGGGYLSSYDIFNNVYTFAVTSTKRYIFCTVCDEHILFVFTEFCSMYLLFSPVAPFLFLFYSTSISVWIIKFYSSLPLYADISSPSIFLCSIL